MSLSIFEDYLDAIKAYFVANLPTHIAAINTEKDDIYNIADMKKTTIGYEDIFAPNNSYPLMCLFPEQFDFEEIAMGIDDNNTMLNIIIVDTLNGRKETTKNLRYAAAVVNLLKSDWTIGGSIGLSRILKIYNYPPDSDNIGVVNIQIEVTKPITF